ncbi:MAG: MBL fold metallo-hydrolase [Treponema sp.]|nr:MBL fold metallo-hydrolase [Treponema sp.]
MEKGIDSVVVGDIQTNCWLYALDEVAGADGRRPCVVIDPGGEAELIASRLKKLGWYARYIFFTHGHFDHLAGLAGLLAGHEKGLFGDGPLPKTGIHPGDAHYLGKIALSAHRDSMTAAGGSPAYVDALWEPVPEADILFGEGDTAGPFTVLHVPGHTAGSVCFYDEKAGVLFTGDTLFQGDYGRTDLPGGNWEQLRLSLKRLLSMKGETIVCPGHGGGTTIKEERSVHNGTI